MTPKTPIATADEQPDESSLTPIEREVLRFMARGYTYPQIAEAMSISTKTVESHMSEVLRKLGSA